MQASISNVTAMREKDQWAFVLSDHRSKMVGCGEEMLEDSELWSRLV